MCLPDRQIPGLRPRSQKRSQRLYDAGFSFIVTGTAGTASACSPSALVVGAEYNESPIKNESIKNER